MEKMDAVPESHSRSWFFETLDNWFEFQADFLMQYGWRLLGGVVVSVFLWNWLQPKIEAWKRAREDAAYHKDPDRVLAREEALARARAAQAERLRAESERHAELLKEKEEKKRREAAELLEKHGYVTGGRRLGTAEDGTGTVVTPETSPKNHGVQFQGYLPLSGGGAGSSYRAPKRSACSGGGCGR